MKLDTTLLNKLVQDSEVVPGNVYPAMGCKKTPSTEFWLVIAVSNTGAHCVGFNLDGYPVSATTYLKSAMRSRPVLMRVDLSPLVLTERIEGRGVTMEDFYANGEKLFNKISKGGIQPCT